ncbi:MAG: phosphomannomutase CpsG [bacterium]
MSDKLISFKAYDIRGIVPDQLNVELVYSIGRAYAKEVKPVGPVVVGYDVRLSSNELAVSLIKGLNDAGVNVLDIGLCGTETVYFASAREKIGGGIMITASHNPAQYNGLKLVRSGAVPISGKTGLDNIESFVVDNALGEPATKRGLCKKENVTKDFAKKILSFVDIKKIKPFKIVVNTGNGSAGLVIDELEKSLPFKLIKVNHKPDGTFPNGVPNPMLSETHYQTADVIKQKLADFGVAWDGDYDRCFFFDERGEFVDSYYIVGLLAEYMLHKYPEAKIIHDPRLTWNTLEKIKANGGQAVESRTGHVFIKERMRLEDAVYGGEISGHHYFKDFNYCDSGMIPWMLMSAILSEKKKPLSQLISESKKHYPNSGEINSVVKDAKAVLEDILKKYEPLASKKDMTDGISLEFDHKWRFNLRSSQTEPVIRLNVETNGDEKLLQEKTSELLKIIRA